MDGTPAWVVWSLMLIPPFTAGLLIAALVWRLVSRIQRKRKAP